MDDLAELVVTWLNGDLQETPGHGAPPDPETIPLVPALTVINRGGFITDNSQLAETRDDGRAWNTWVSGFATDATLARLHRAVRGTPLTMTACRGKLHECGRTGFFTFNRRLNLWPCPSREVLGNWSGACPHVTELDDAWYVQVEDPQPGRNDLMWPALVNALKDRS
jgi:hypothetical protein